MRYNLATVVWGEKFTDFFTDVALPNLLTPGNLDELCKTERPIFRIFTTEKDAVKIKLSAAFKKISGLIAVEITIINDTDFSQNYTIVSKYHQKAISAAISDDAAILIIGPDVIRAEGYMRNLLRIAESGKRAVMVSEIRVAKETFLPEFMKRFLVEDILQGIGSRQLVKLALEHLHPASRSFLWSCEKFSNAPAMIYFEVPGEGILARCFHMSPALVGPVGKNIRFSKTIDGDFILKACPDISDIYVQSDSDELISVEVSDLSYRSYAGKKPPSPLDIAAFAKYSANSHNRIFLKHKIRFHFTDISDKWEKVGWFSDEIVNNIFFWLKFEPFLFWPYGISLKARSLARRIVKLFLGESATKKLIGSIRTTRADVLAKIRQRGACHCLKRAAYESLCRTTYVISGILAYPFCLITNIRFIPFHFRSIGHLCVEPDCYIKEEILGMRPKYNSIALAPKDTVSNEHLLRYWEGRGIKIIRSPVLCFLLKPLSRNKFSGYDVYKYAFSYRSAFPAIQKMYNGRPALLSLTESDRERGRRALESVGVPRESWFVCVHCREDGYLGDVDQANRNCNIDNYLPAMEMIVKRGGLVIRMGDPTMKKLPQMDRVIDYAHLKLKNDWMDIFLSASCRFFLGSNSGLHYTSAVFGVPGAIANYSPMSISLSYGTGDIGIPKLVWSVRENRYLTFREVFADPISNYRLDSLFTKAGVNVIENSPEDIKDLVIEMFDRIENKASYTDEDEVLQERFKSLMNPSHYSYGAISRVGRDFLRKYKHLL